MKPFSMICSLFVITMIAQNPVSAKSIPFTKYLSSPSTSLATPTPVPALLEPNQVPSFQRQTITISDEDYMFDTYNHWHSNHWHENYVLDDALLVMRPDTHQYTWGSAWFQIDINRFFMEELNLPRESYRIIECQIRIHFRGVDPARVRFQTLYLHQPESVWEAEALTTNHMPVSAQLFSFTPQYGGWNEISDPILAEILNSYRTSGQDSEEWKKGFAIRPINPGTAPYPGEEISWHSMQTEDPEVRPQFVITYEAGPPPTPTPIPEELVFSNFDDSEEWQIFAPAGYRQGRVQFTGIPEGEGTDGFGLRIDLSPGQGVWISNNYPIDVDGFVRLSASFHGTGSTIEAALVALNSPFDGQYGYTYFTGSAVPYEQYQKFNFVYSPPSGQFNYAIQAVNSQQTSFTQTLYVDELKAETFTPVLLDSKVTEVDGSFDYGLHGLLTNVNEDDGEIIPFFESLTDVAIKLSLLPENLAANIGTKCVDLEDRFPFNLLAGVTAIRETSPNGGTCGMVITNSFQNIGVFYSVNNLPESGSNQYDPLIVGGNFTTSNPTTPIHVFIQNGGPDVKSSIVIDDLAVKIE